MTYRKEKVWVGGKKNGVQKLAWICEKCGQTFFKKPKKIHYLETQNRERCK